MIASAQPTLADKTIADIVVGVSLIGVQLSDGCVGVSYVLREELPGGCSAFDYVSQVCGMSAAEVAQWVLIGQDSLKKAIGSAVLTAAANDLNPPDDDKTGAPFGLDIHPEDTACMIGFIPPVAHQMAQRCNLIIFDKGLQYVPEGVQILPMKEQPERLPQCDIVLLSGTTSINGTIDSLLAMCTKAREIVMVGPSTPMFAGWQGSGITTLAGSVWKGEKKTRSSSVFPAPPESSSLWTA